MIYIVIAALAWGSSFPVITYALRDTSPFVFVVLRFLVAFAVLVPRFRSLRQFKMVFHRPLFLLSIPNAVAHVLQFKAQEITTASKTALFVNSSPVFTAVFAALILRERLHPRQLLAVAVAFAGVAVTSTGLDFSDLSNINLGDVMCMAVGACWAVFIIYSKPLVERYPAVTLAQALYFWTAVMALPLALTEDVRLAASSGPAIVYLALAPTILGYFLFLKGLKTVSAVSSSVVILIEVVVAFAIAALFLGESFSPVEAVGALMVIAGVLMVSGAERRRR